MIEPETIDIDRERGVTIEWPDGARNFYLNQELRAVCPCAECRGLRDRGIAVGTKPVTITDAKLVGNWGLGITWSDGHSTGIYSWEGLRGSVAEP